jgi:hypothetical protein
VGLSDTTPEIQEEMLRRFQAMTPEGRFLRGIALIEAGWEMARYAVRRRYQPTSESDFRNALLQWMYGSDEMSSARTTL